MAIDRLKQVWLLVDPEAGTAALEELAQMRLIHLADCLPDDEHLEAGIRRLSGDLSDIDTRLAMLNEIIAALSEHHKAAKGLLASFIPLPMEITLAELDGAVDAVDVEAMHRQVQSLAEERTGLLARLERVNDELARAEAVRGLSAPLPDETSLKWTAVFLGLVPSKQVEDLLSNESLAAIAAVEVLSTAGPAAAVALACLKDQSGAVQSALKPFGFTPLGEGRQSASLDRYVTDLTAEQAELVRQAADLASQLAEIAAERHRDIEIVLGYWEGRRESAAAVEKAVASKRVALIRGYVRTRDLERLEREVNAVPQGIQMFTEDPSPHDNVPVSLTNTRFFRPASFLIEMFGLPSYFAFDPSPFIQMGFLVFFGFCFGDVLYGIMLIALGLLLARKYRDYSTLKNFFTLFAYGGVTSIIVGALTGSWAADLWDPAYLGVGNWLLWLKNSVPVFDPMDKPLIALLVALACGVLNQFYGILMRMKLEILKRDWIAAIFDAGMWLLVLPGLMIMAAKMFAPVPSGLFYTGVAIFGVGTIGLIFTQGRKEDTLIGKAIVGLVSCYGILGSYGCTAFIGDTLSYSRLLALGLTTVIVGKCFNMIGGMLREMVPVPVLGVILFVLVVVLGHIFNFVISILGAFVHSARLIFVEFFGRFYDAGSPRFTPLGASAGRIRVIDK